MVGLVSYQGHARAASQIQYWNKVATEKSFSHPPLSDRYRELF
jgi:hypothetical protein